MTVNSFDVATQDFNEKVIDGSKQAPVLVDFWAEWCGPCRVLKPILEKLAQEYGGKFKLAKLNVDEHPALAAQFGVRGIPNVKAFRDGELVDEFTGAQPERTVRAFVDRLLPSEAELLRRAAMQTHAHGDPAAALQALQRAAELEPNNDKIRIDAAEVALALGLTDEARAQIAALGPLSDNDDRVLNLRARLQFAAAGGAADIRALEDRVSRDDKNLGARMQLANAYVAQRRYAEAMDQLLEVIKRDRSYDDDAARRTMLSIFSLITDQDELIGKYRRLLASALH